MHSRLVIFEKYNAFSEQISAGNHKMMQGIPRRMATVPIHETWAQLDWEKAKRRVRFQACDPGGKATRETSDSEIARDLFERFTTFTDRLPADHISQVWDHPGQELNASY